MSKTMAEASLVSAVFTARRKNANSAGATSPRSGTTATSPLRIASRPKAGATPVKEQIRNEISNLILTAWTTHRTA
jgi:hypothetical protein